MNYETPKLTELRVKKIEVGAVKAANIAEIKAIQLRIQNDANPGSAAENKVRAILGQALIPDTSPDVERLQELYEEVRTLDIALERLDRDIQAERSEASRILCRKVRPEVDRLGKTFAAALVTLHKTLTEYQGYIDEIENTGASTSSLPSIWLSGMGSVKDHSGGFHYAFADLVEAKFIQRNDVPEAVR